jgi:ribonuclease-3
MDADGGIWLASVCEVAMTEDLSDIRHRLEEICSHAFAQPGLIDEALTHASVAENHLASNERMEFLGDAVLGFVVCEYLYQKFPEEREGELTKIKSAVVSRRTCAMLSDVLGLTDLLNLGKGMTDRDDLPPSLAAAVYESVVAAIYLDAGIDRARQFILSHMTEVIDEAAASAHQHNFKSVLQQYAQRATSDLPSYILLDEKGPDHSKCFEVCVEIGGNRYPSQWGQSKKQAEQLAALAALKAMGVMSEGSDGSITLVDNGDD